MQLFVSMAISSDSINSYLLRCKFLEGSRFLGISAFPLSITVPITCSLNVCLPQTSFVIWRKAESLCESIQNDQTHLSCLIDSKVHTSSQFNIFEIGMLLTVDDILQLHFTSLFLVHKTTMCFILSSVLYSMKCGSYLHMA